MKPDRFHVHLTLPAKVKKAPLGWKRTDIVLLSGEPQTDYMITRHFVVGISTPSLPELIEANVLLLKNLKGLRIKVERDNNFSPITSSNYLECHCKVKGECKLSGDWIRSRNAIEPDVYFWNRRIRQPMSFEEGCQIIDAEILACSRMENIINYKIEQNIFDSNVDRDLWWENSKYTS